MKFKHLLSGLLIGSTSLAIAQQKDIEFVEYDLENGLHVILHEDNSTPIVAVSVMYHVGSKDEDTNRTGFAHFFEHLLFEGSENIERGEYDGYVERAGGSLNANTSQDRTYYFEFLPSNQLELGLWLESERMLHAKVNQEGVETQREVVKEEKRQRVDNQPYGTFMTETFVRAYKEHPYRWMPIGSMDHLNAAQEEDYVNFYKKFYVPNNAVLSIAGDIDLEQTKKWIADYFGTIPTGDKLNVYRDYERLDKEAFEAAYLGSADATTKSAFEADYGKISTEEILAKYFANVSGVANEIVRNGIVEKPLAGEIRDTIYDNIQLPAVIEAYRLPERGTKEFYAVEMMSKILSEGASSRLYKNLVDSSLAVAAFAFPFPLEDPGIALMLSIASMGVTPDILETAIDNEITKLQTELISEKELQKLKNSVENDFIGQFSSISSVAENLANYYMYYDGQTNLINDEIENYLSVTREEIQEAAKKYFVKDNRVILYYLPKK